MIDEVENNSPRDKHEPEGVTEYFQKIKSLFVCTYLYFDVFVRSVCHVLPLHPRSLPISTKGAKSPCAEFNLNILYLILSMLDFLGFFSVKT